MLRFVMGPDKISIRFFSKSLGLETREWPVKDFKYVEDLIFDILSSLGVGPVYRYLFGLRLANKQDIWLTPNLVISDLLNPSGISIFEKPLLLDLRMRFRPSSLPTMLANDKLAFEMVFAQIRYDFLHTKFTNEKRDFILLNESVMGMIASDLLRHALEHDLMIAEIFKRVNIKDFTPQRASRWQRSLLFHLETIPSSILSMMEILSTTSDKDISRVKREFIQLFFEDLCTNYGSEVYNVIFMDHQNNGPSRKLRVRYEQTTKESYCIIEYQPMSRVHSSKANEDWTELCEIESVSYGTLRHNIVEINRSNGVPLRIIFDTEWHAKSFLSLLDGYCRLMKKWHFNFCRSVSSPELEELKRARCHGPIGYETMCIKLPLDKEAGTFLVRKCMEKINKYIIDVILLNKERLCLDIEWIPDKKIYKYCDFLVSGDITVTIVSNPLGYSTLKKLVNDLQVKLDDRSECLPLQLRHLIPISEYDDCPALLLSISKSKLREFNKKLDKIEKPLSELPRLIPRDMICFTKKLTLRANNRMFVRLANLCGGQEVIVKDCIDHGSYDVSKLHNTCYNDMIWDIRRKDARNKLSQRLMPAQYRLLDWIFIKNSSFAETTGLDFDRNALIQEYFPLGSLTNVLIRSGGLTEILRRSVCCQLAHALLFLQEKRVIHGKIRCHNVFVKSLNPGKDIQVKITDPLGTFDADKDLAFLSPEYFRCGGQISEYNSGIDVWALGTTIWQIYSLGARPPPSKYANSTLVQPKDCPNSLWSVIESCWILDLGRRASPQSIYRDINDSYAWDKENHSYDYVLLTPVTEDDSNQSTNSDLPKVNGKPSRQSSVSIIISNGGSETSKESGSHALPLSANRLTSLNTPMRQNGKTISRSRVERSLKSIFFKNKSTNVHSKLDRDHAYDRHPNTSKSIPSLSDLKTVSTVIRESSQPNIAAPTSWSIDMNNLKLGPEVGRGSAGIVIKGVLLEWGGLSDQVVAVKCINDSDTSNINHIEDLRREFEILKTLDHKNIVKTLGFVEDGSVKLVVEYLSLGSLLSYIKNSQHNQLINLPLMKYATDIAQGMQYLESKKIVHRDLALRNILLKNQYEVKICDFGLAQFVDTDNHYKLKTSRALPLRWYAPETLTNWIFTHKTDVWSYGVVLWEIYSGGCNPQYSGTYANLSETLKHERLLAPRDCPENMYNLMLSCWAYNPDERYSFSQICERLISITDSPTDTFCNSTSSL